jgi:hypothetical protein
LKRDLEESKIRGSIYRKCRVCGKNVKIVNFEKHFETTHPLQVNRLKILQLVAGKCVVCGVDLFDNEQYACLKHTVEITPKFLVKKVLLPLRDNTDRIIRKSGNECIDYFFQFFLESLHVELGTDTTKIGYEALAIHSAKSLFLSYVLLRLCNVIPLFGKRAYELANSDSGRGSLRTRYDTEFLEALSNEFEFFFAAYWGSQGLYRLATDSEDNPSRVIVIPSESEEAILTTVMLRVREAEFVYRTSLYPVIHRTSEECFYDENGGFLCFSRDEIIEKFDLFDRIWCKIFGSKLPINATEYLNFQFWFKFVTAPFGFTKEKKTKAHNLADYEDLNEDTIFLLLNAILPDVCSKVHLISTKCLAYKDVNRRVLYDLGRLSWGFRVSFEDRISYFLPVIDWIVNVVEPVIARFGRTLNAAGTFYENWIKENVEAFARGLLGFKFTQYLGYVPVRRTEKEKRVIRDWRVLERNLKIEVEIGDSRKAPEQGEIDLVVYANYNIYLLELKSSNLIGKKALKYLNKKAPMQCSKYSSWARKRENVKRLMKKHKIPEDKVSSIRILCCTNGVYDRTSIKNVGTGEIFATVPLFLLFNLFAGVFTVAIRNSFLPSILEIRNGLKTALPSLKEAYLLDNAKELSAKTNGIIQNWYALMTFDRRQSFAQFQAKAPNSFMFGRFLINREAYVGNTSRWILKRPLLLGIERGINFYVGTQIGTAGTTLYCPYCKSAIKYYQTTNQEENSKVVAFLAKENCPLCHRHVKEALNHVEIASIMSRFALKFKNDFDGQAL